MHDLLCRSRKSTDLAPLQSRNGGIEGRERGGGAGDFVRAPLHFWCLTQPNTSHTRGARGARGARGWYTTTGGGVEGNFLRAPLHFRRCRWIPYMVLNTAEYKPPARDGGVEGVVCYVEVTYAADDTRKAGVLLRRWQIL